MHCKLLISMLEAFLTFIISKLCLKLPYRKYIKNEHYAKTKNNNFLYPFILNLHGIL